MSQPLTPQTISYSLLTGSDGSLNARYHGDSDWVSFMLQRPGEERPSITALSRAESTALADWLACVNAARASVPASSEYAEHRAKAVVAECAQLPDPNDAG